MTSRHYESPTMRTMALLRANPYHTVSFYSSGPMSAPDVENRIDDRMCAYTAAPPRGPLLSVRMAQVPVTVGRGAEIAGQPRACRQLDGLCDAMVTF
jgi:hypothetical protein